MNQSEEEDKKDGRSHDEELTRPAYAEFTDNLLLVFPWHFAILPRIGNVPIIIAGLLALFLVLCRGSSAMNHIGAQFKKPDYAATGENGEDSMRRSCCNATGVTTSLAVSTFPPRLSKGGRVNPPFVLFPSGLLSFYNVDSLWSFWALLDIESHLLTFSKRLEAIAHDRGMMDKDIASIFGCNESKSL
jgi:hypothetical protein